MGAIDVRGLLLIFGIPFVLALFAKKGHHFISIMVYALACLSLGWLLTFARVVFHDPIGPYVKAIVVGIFFAFSIGSLTKILRGSAGHKLKIGVITFSLVLAVVGLANILIITI